MAMDMMLEETDPKHRQRLIDSLTGRFRTMGAPLDSDEINAPSWWHGDEEAYESASSMMGSLPQRR